MPVLLRVGPYVFFIVMFDCLERMHVHVKGGGSGEAKVWLDRDGGLAASTGYTPRQVERIAGIVRDHRRTLVERWIEACEGATA
jgi:hypothetical protein